MRMLVIRVPIMTMVFGMVNIIGLLPLYGG